MDTAITTNETTTELSATATPKVKKTRKPRRVKTETSKRHEPKVRARDLLTEAVSFLEGLPGDKPEALVESIKNFLAVPAKIPIDEAAGYYIDLPRSLGDWENIGTMNGARALAYVKRNYNADDYGRICLLTKVSEE